MSLSRSVFQVRVEEGVLWVGGEAYPLRNISHVGQRKLEINKEAAWKKFIVRSLMCLVVGGILAAAVGAIGTIILIAVLALLIWQLASVLKTPPVYGLVISTSGTQRDAVWSTVKHEIDHLVNEITKAIGKPDVAKMVFNVTHAVHGDHIQQYGEGNVGTQRHSGFGDNMAGR